MPIAAWGLIVAGGLVLGAIPLFIGLVIVMPVLCHATWHLYRKLVPRQHDAITTALTPRTWLPDSAAMFEDLKGRVALVTGGATGIGGAISAAFGAAGMKVAVHYHAGSEAARRRRGAGPPRRR